MGTKKNSGKLMKPSLSSSKKRKLDVAQMESPIEREFSSKDKELKALRDLLAEQDAKIADLQKQLDWAMNTAALHEKMTKMSDEIAEIKTAQTELASKVTDCEVNSQFHSVQIQSLTAQVEKMKQGQLDEVLEKTIKDFMQ